VIYLSVEWIRASNVTDQCYPSARWIFSHVLHQYPRTLDHQTRVDTFLFVGHSVFFLYLNSSTQIIDDNIEGLAGELAPQVLFTPATADLSHNIDVPGLAVLRFKSLFG
jgi:hypothetical protein